MNPIITWLNQSAGFWSKLVFQSAWQSALVGLGVLAVVWWGRRWPAPLRYGLLLLALAKFAVPPLWPVSLGLFGLASPAAAVAAPGASVAPASFSRSISGEPGAGWVPDERGRAGEANPATLPPGGGPVSRAHRSPLVALSWRAWLMLAHAAGTGAILFWILVQALRLRRLTNQGRAPCNDGLWRAWTGLAARMRVRRLPRLLVVPATCSPMALGLLRPAILLPSRVGERLSAPEVEAILGHELAHIRRGDLWVNWAQLLLWALWWFHPVLWLVNRAVRRVREDCCDDLLLARGITSANDYCEVLVRAARELLAHRPVAAALGCAETLHPLGQRVVRLMDGGISRWARLSKASLLGAVALALLVLPGLRSQEATAAKAPKPGTPGTPASAGALSPEPGAASSANATALPSLPATTNQAPSYEASFGKLKWFGESAWGEAPPLLESKRIAREMRPQAIPFLIAKLKKQAAESDNNVEERRKAAWALGQLGAAGKAAVPALIQALGDQGDRARQPEGHFLIAERVCTVAATALGEIGPAAKDAVAALKESLHYGVGSALLALAKIAPESRQTLAVLTEALQDYSQGNRSGEISYHFEALRGLALLAEVQAEALSAIGVALKDPELCNEAVKLLLANRRFSAGAAATLDRGWKEGSLVERSEVAAALSYNGRRSPELLAVMLQRVQQGEGDLSAQFVWGLALCGNQAKPAIPYLVRTLGGAMVQASGQPNNQEFAQALIYALGAIAKGDEEAGRSLEPYLLLAAHDPNLGTRPAALTALGKVRIDPKKGIPALLEALDDPSPQIRSAALEGLSEYGAAAKETVPRIVALLEDKNHGTAAVAAIALGRLGTNAQSAVPALIKALDSAEDGLCNNAANALGKFGPAARPAIPALEKVLQHSSGTEKLNAAFSLWRIDGRTDVVPILIKRLESQAAWDPMERLSPQNTRSFMLDVLGEIGPPAKAAVPLLQQMLQTAEPGLQAEIQTALERITPPAKPAADL